MRLWFDARCVVGGAWPAADLLLGISIRMFRAHMGKGAGVMVLHLSGD